MTDFEVVVKYQGRACVAGIYIEDDKPCAVVDLTDDETEQSYDVEKLTKDEIEMILYKATDEYREYLRDAHDCSERCRC